MGRELAAASLAIHSSDCALMPMSVNADRHTAISIVTIIVTRQRHDVANIMFDTTKVVIARPWSVCAAAQPKTFKPGQCMRGEEQLETFSDHTITQPSQRFDMCDRAAILNGIKSSH